MEEKEFVNKLFAVFSNNGLVQSFRSQLRLGIHKFSTNNRDYSYQPFIHSLKTELICNIISDYFEKYAYSNSLNVFIEESGFHKMENSDILRLSHISKCDRTYLEELIEKRKRNMSRRDSETQCSTQTLQEKLSFVDEKIRQKKQAVRNSDRRRIVQNRLEQMRKEKEAELQNRLQFSYDSQTTIEKSKARIEQTEKYRTSAELMKSQYESMFLKKSAEFRIAREQEEESTKLLQEELDRQLQRLKRSYETAPTSVTAQDVHNQTQKKLKKLLANAQKLIQKRNRIKQQLKQEQEAHKESIKELTILQHKFASININHD